MPITGNEPDYPARKMWFDTRLCSLIVLPQIRCYLRGANVRGFQSNPSVNSILKFPGKTRWAGEQVEACFIPEKGDC